MTNTALRALVGSRVSVMRKSKHKSQGKVSHLAQREIGYRKAAELGARVVDTFEDLDVSATVSPFERPDLREWLDVEQRGHEWDVIIWSTLDRGFRDPRDAIALADWCERNGKMMVLAEQGIVLDYRQNADTMARMLAEMFLLIGSMFAKWELKNHQTRASDAHSVLRELDRWAGGPAPEGFQIVPHPSGKGSGLDTAPDRKELLYKMASLLLEEDSFNGIAKWLTANGYPTNIDRQRAPENRKSGYWHVSDVIKALTSPATQGFKLNGGQPVIGADGMPVRIAPPTFDDHTWRRIQTAVSARRMGPRRVHGTSPLLGVCYCGKCSASAVHHVTVRETKRNPEGATHRYYRCGRRPSPCSKVGMKAEDVEILLAEEFLEQCGSLPVLERIFLPGEDHTEELNKVKASIARLERESDVGLIVTSEDEERYFTRMKSLVASRTALEKLPQRQAGWDYRATGKTYGEAWLAADEDSRRKLLANAGVRFMIHGLNEWEVRIPQDIKGRLSTPPL